MLPEKLRFTQDDFKVGDEWVNPAVAHELVNRLLEEKLGETQTLYGLKILGAGWNWSEERVGEDTHTGHLVSIQKLRK